MYKGERGGVLVEKGKNEFKITQTYSGNTLTKE